MSNMGTVGAGPRAGFWRRFAAAFLDGIVLFVVYLILYAIGLHSIAYVVSLLGGLAYYGYFEGSSSGQTPGKHLLGIRVYDFAGGGGDGIGFGRAVVRYLGRIVSAIPCYLGYLWMLWDKDKQTWHDKFSSTVVVPVEQYPVASWPG